MDKFLKFFNLFRGGKEGLACNAIVDSEISPHRDFFAIGDIHGCYSSLASLLTKVESVSTGGEAMVFLGDFIDRGPESSRVLRKLYCLCLDAPEDIVVLMGNHERMMLEFIDDPLGNGGLWLRSGGIQTLESFGIKNVPENPDTDEAMDIADQLESSLPDGMQDWLRRLPLKWQSGNVWCVHAAMKPDVHPENQNEKHLLWGHPSFFSNKRTDGVYVVHGHTIVPRPVISRGRVSIDTGAYKGGKLTCAHVSKGNCNFLQSID